MSSRPASRAVSAFEMAPATLLQSDWSKPVSTAVGLGALGSEPLEFPSVALLNPGEPASTGVEPIAFESPTPRQ